MPTQALYNKWRSQTFDEILGQEHITQTLRNQIRAGRIGHAYLFTGMRGTGKTTTARVLAKAVNCVGDTDDPPCNVCHICKSISDGSCLDLIEIDAASNRGIDEIRDLRERVSFAPHECRYKVYVIDEVHMLTTEAFNALLKTLEEPPSHVIFILCTTEPHRLPDTILSRCQRFDFRRVSVSLLIKKLKRICEGEGIRISPEALDLVARRAAGSFRDAESLLDQLSAYDADEITLELVRDVLGSVPSVLVSELVEHMMAGDVPRGLRLINEALEGGAEPRQFLSDILEHLRAVLLLSVGGDEGLQQLSPHAFDHMRQLARNRTFSLKALVESIRLFNEAGEGLRNAVRPQLPLELALIETALAVDGEAEGGGAAESADVAVEEAADERGKGEEGGASGRRIAEAAPAAEPEAAGEEGNEDAGAVGIAADWEEESPEEPENVTPEPEEEQEKAPAPAQKLTLDWVCGNWDLVLMKIKLKSYQVRALLNSAYPISVRDDLVTLGCNAKFHCDKLSEDKRRDLVEDVLSQVLGVSCRVQCVVDREAGERARSRTRSTDDNAEDLFGSERSEAPSDDDLRDELLNHPAVKALKERGGRVSKVTLDGQR
ncbi:MAG: DNA polymerase III subunit gamma/tau [Chloroflexota bacterium]|nr:DNA polymerase III subunit gamma/tau [Chloroflexota bacterium]